MKIIWTTDENADTFDVLRKHGFLQHQFLNGLDQRLHLCWRENVLMTDLLH